MIFYKMFSFILFFISLISTVSSVLDSTRATAIEVFPNNLRERCGFALASPNVAQPAMEANVLDHIDHYGVTVDNYMHNMVSGQIGDRSLMRN
jgi:hypothetical protein